MPKGIYKHIHRPWNKDKKGIFSLETRKKISEAQKGNKKRLGKYHNEETKNKIRFKKLGSKHTEKTKKKMSLAHKGKQPKNSINWKGKNHPHWKGGISFNPYPVDWTKTLKRSIRERDKYTCQICGKEPSIYCHHIDYNKLNCNPENLITLCHSCHTKTNFNRNYWIEYFKKLSNNLI